MTLYIPSFNFIMEPRSPPFVFNFMPVAVGGFFSSCFHRAFIARFFRAIFFARFFSCLFFAHSYCIINKKLLLNHYKNLYVPIFWSADYEFLIRMPLSFLVFFFGEYIKKIAFLLLSNI